MGSPSSHVSVDDEKDLSIHELESSADATESSAEEDDAVAVEEEASNEFRSPDMKAGEKVARRPDGVNVGSPQEPTRASAGDNVVVNGGRFLRPPLKPNFGNARPGMAKVLCQSWIDQPKCFQILERTCEAWQNDREARHMAHHGTLVKDMFGQDETLAFFMQFRMLT